MPGLHLEPPVRRPRKGLMTVCTATKTPVFVRGEGFEAKAPKPKLREMAKQTARTTVPQLGQRGMSLT